MQKKFVARDLRTSPHLQPLFTCSLEVFGIGTINSENSFM